VLADAEDIDLQNSHVDQAEASVTLEKKRRDCRRLLAEGLESHVESKLREAIELAKECKLSIKKKVQKLCTTFVGLAVCTKLALRTRLFFFC
jgi:hypothetical protein